MFKNLFILVVFLFQAILLTTSLSCTTTENLDNPTNTTLEQSNEARESELNKLKQELTDQQAELTSKSIMVSELEETRKDLSKQLSEKTDRLDGLETKLTKSQAKLIETENKLNQVEYPIAIMSSDGEIVTFASAPQRIIAFDSSAVEILFDIGESNKVIATHSFATHPSTVSNLPKVGDAFNLDLEAIVALEPDLVFVFYESNVQPLRKLGLKVLYIKTLDHNFEKTTELMRMWGRITNNMEGASTSINDFNTKIDIISKKVDSSTKGPRIFQDIGGLWTPGANTLVHEVFELLKADNIAKEIDGYAQISPEIIVEKNPQIIITPNPEVFLENKAYENISAVKNNKIYSLQSDSLSVPGPRFPDGIIEIAKYMYPNKFEDIKNP